MARLKKQEIASNKINFIDETIEWLHLTPGRRLLETTKLWKFYLALGGSLDPEPNPQSPFYLLYEEETAERKTDADYWAPLIKELEILRHQRSKN